jgi:hypothetical protein
MAIIYKGLISWVFVPGKPFQPSLIFSGKARSGAKGSRASLVRDRWVIVADLINILRPITDSPIKISRTSLCIHVPMQCCHRAVSYGLKMFMNSTCVSNQCYSVACTIKNYEFVIYRLL